MKMTSNQPPAMLPARGAFLTGDLARSRDHFNVDLLPTPSNFFTVVARKALECQRILVAAQLLEQQGERSNVEELITAFSNGIHVSKKFRTEDNDHLLDESFLRACIGEAGIDKSLADRLMEMKGTDEVKAQLTANTEEAVSKGAYGSPTLIIEGGLPPHEEPFMVFGSDRFEQIAHICGKPYYGPDPSRPSKL